MMMRRSTPRHRCDGFTLVELSIVLVIVALVIGGVVLGQELIRAATIRSQAAQLREFSTGVRSFKMKYGDLPGDITRSNALAFGLPTRAPGGGWWGNENGAYDSASSAGAFGYLATDEQNWFYPQLAAAGLISGRYNVPCYNDAYQYVNAAPDLCSRSREAGTDFPGLKLNPQLIAIPLTAARSFGGEWFVLGARNLLYWLSDPTVSQPALTPADAFTLDAKIDDGVPSTGGVRAIRGFNGSAANVYNHDSWIGNDNLPASNCVTTSAGRFYNVADPEIRCRVAVKMQ